MRSRIKNPLTEPTGDPFADVGGYVIKALWEEPRYRDKSILELIEYITNVYISQWNSNLHAFFLNSKITQPAFDSQRKLQETMAYYRSLVDETAPYKEGHCRISGRKTKLFAAGRDNHILSGSSTFVNFHHGFESGLYLSKEVIIRFFFVPFGCMQLGDKLAIIGSNNTVVADYFVQQILFSPDGPLNSIGRNMGGGVAKSMHGIPANALFAFADSCIKDIPTATYSEDNVVSARDTSLSFYHFTNFGAKPEIVLYQLPGSIFKFYAFCQTPTVREAWRQFLSTNYRNSKVKNPRYDLQSGTLITDKETIEADTFSTWRNDILIRLLDGRSLVSFFRKWARKHSFPFIIVEKYLLLAKNMDKQTTRKIREIANFIAESGEDGIKRGILRLNRAQYSYQVRQFLLKLIDENYKANGEKPLLRLEEVEYLFPDTAGWREIRDLILIAIYEKVHDMRLTVDTGFEEQESEPSNEEVE